MTSASGLYTHRLDIMLYNIISDAHFAQITLSNIVCRVSNVLGNRRTMRLSRID